MQKPATLGAGGLWARALRSSVWIALGFTGGQILRFGSNLILTRLLFPEAFGLMALITMCLVGLAMFSDVGLGPSISGNRRGDDPDFLNTGWTLQVIRGAGLWLATCLLAAPVAAFYGEPQLLQMLPVAGLLLLIMGFYPTRILTAHRHLMVGRVTGLELAAQAIGIASMIFLSWLWQSVWALVIGGLVSSGATLVLTSLFLPGPRNRFRWERAAVAELVRFGKWIFLATALGFLLAQGDKAILGKFLSLKMLGIYNIGFFLASFPTLLAGAVISRVMIPVYRDSLPAGDLATSARLRRLRSLVTGGTLALLIALALGGVPLVHLLYDPAYAAAGAVVVLVASVQMLSLIALTYDQAALAAGDSRGFFTLQLARAALMVGGMLIGATHWGLVGALAGQAVAVVLAHPFVAWLSLRHRAWDPLHDAGFALIALAAAATALWLNAADIAALAAVTR